MPEPGPRYPVDYAGLAESLRALASPQRLELLDQLRFPHRLGEIRVTPQRHAPGQNPDRPASKPAVLAHLEKLIEADLVQPQEPVEPGQGQAARAYVANPERLYAALEDLRSIVVRHAGRGAGQDATATFDPASGAGDRPEGPHLVLVRGLYDGKVYPLRARRGEEERWRIGRRAGLPVAVEYDRYVSLENAEIRRERGGFVLHDLDSKNGTWLNWKAVEAGAPLPLRSADLIGVGRSLLMFVS